MASVSRVEEEVSSSPTVEPDSSIVLSKEAQARIEVALYASGPLTLDELSRVSRIVSKRRLNEIMRELAGKINSTFVSIELEEMRDDGASLH